MLNRTPENIDPATEYQARLHRWTLEAERWERLHRRLGGWRIVFAAVVVAISLWLGKTFVGLGIVLAGGIVALFFSGMVHDRVLQRREAARRAVSFYRLGLDRLVGQWAGKGSPGTEFLDKHHPYAGDLDIFGEGSVFELLNAAQTQTGRATLARWLLQRAPLHEIQARQLAVAELRGKLDLRESLAMLAPDTKASIDTPAFLAWASRPAHSVSAPVRLIAFGLPWLTWGLLIGGQYELFSLALVAQSALARLFRRPVAQIYHSTNWPSGNLEWLAALLRRLESEQFQTAGLQQWQARWRREGRTASAGVRRLARWLACLDSRDHFLFAVIGRLFLLKTQLAFALQAWRARYGPSVADWLQGLAEMEAFSSLARYAFERPANVYAELLPASGAALIEADGLGHPLIAPDRAVCNDLRLDSNQRLLVISGSNMSGKSTFLRALGVNLVLAMAGAPVVARRLRLTPVQIGASMRTVDSLQEGVSRFYAEITRLRQIVQLTGGDAPLLFLLDELLSGTNSHDRRIGAGSIVRNLIDRGAMGLITTHDLALAQIVEEVKPHGANFHFEDQFTDGKISFDYQLRPGVVEKSNALHLMRSIGLEV